MTRPLEWMTAVRDHPDRPPPIQCHVLTCLVLRMGWRTGKGFASVAQLATDADCQRRTVQRATAWARKHGLLILVQRGHRLSDGAVRASEWRLHLPPQGVSGDTSTEILRCLDPGLEVTAAPFRGDSRELPSRPNPSRPNPSSAHARVREDGGAVRRSPEEGDQEKMTIDQDIDDKNDDHPGKGQCPDCGQWFKIKGGGLLDEHGSCVNSSGKPVEWVPCRRCGRIRLPLPAGGLCGSCYRATRRRLGSGDRGYGTCPSCGDRILVTRHWDLRSHYAPSQPDRYCPGSYEAPAGDVDWR